jgi:RNA polymerase sigma-70 factor (ECF subfamily)
MNHFRKLPGEFEALMSTVVIGFGTDIRDLETGSGQVSSSVPSAPEHGSHSPMQRKSDLKHDPACPYDLVREPDMISAAMNGDHAAFVELCHLYTDSLKRRIQRIVRNREDAEDVLQDTLLRAYAHLSGFRGTCTFRTWLTTIAINSSLMLLRKRKSRRETGIGIVTAEGSEIEILELSDPSPNPEQVYAKRQASDRIAWAVTRLPQGSRDIVQRYYHQDGLTLVDAANAVGITQSTAKSRLLRARNALRRHLGTH